MGVFFAGSCFAALPPLSDENRFNQPLIVQAEPNSYPNSYLTEEGKGQGYAVDLLDAIARVMGLKLQRVYLSAGEYSPMELAEKFDLIQTYGATPEREPYLDFSVPYLDLQGAVFIQKNTSFHTTADLKTAEVAVIGVGSGGDVFVRSRLPEAHIIHAKTVEDGLKMLNAGLCDAVFASRLTGLAAIERTHLTNIATLDERLEGFDVRFCFAVRDGDFRLLARINEGIAILHRTGEFDKIYRKWYGQWGPRVFTREELVTYIAGGLAIALLAALWIMRWQNSLRKRIARQAAQLAESEALLAEAQQIAHLGHWRYDAVLHALTFSAETLHIIERRPGDAPPSYFRMLTMLPRADRAVAHRALRAALRNGTAADFTVPVRLRVSYTRIVHVTARPLRNSSGHIIGLFGTVQDITHQKAAEENVRAREQLLRALYDNVPIALGVIEATGSSFRFVSANTGTARLLGLESTPLANRILAELPLPTTVVEFWTHWFQKGLNQTELFKIEYYQENTRQHYAITLIPLAGAHQQLCFLVENITERKQIDAEVSQGRRLRAIGELVGGIAHEFNNLLTPIMLKTEILASEWVNDPRLLEELQTISRASKRGAELTRRLLTFGRRSDVRFEEIHLHQIVQANFDLLKPTIDRRISLVSNVRETLPTLFLNPSDLHQIVLNLLLNARDTLTEKLGRDAANAWNAQILVEAVEHETGTVDPSWAQGDHHPLSWLRLSVRDNGMGMSRDVQERIFEPFYTTKEVGKGTGLGLATVWHLANRLGGKVTVDSLPGMGSSFHIWLPVFAPQEKRSATNPPMVPRTAKTSAHIFLVEDDELVAKTVAMALQRKGHQVTHYANGNDAWLHLSTNTNYDLLLLDLDLPGISGLEIARRAREAAFTGRILIASGRLSEAEVHELDRLGVEGKLQKPFTPDMLYNAIQACLSGQTPDPARGQSGSS